LDLKKKTGFIVIGIAVFFILSVSIIVAYYGPNGPPLAIGLILNEIMQINPVEFDKDGVPIIDYEKLLENVKTVFHLAADPEVRTGFAHPEISFRENIQVTFNLLEEIRKSDVERILFTSSATVYGEPNVMPTSEDYGPLLPISPYGASKLAAEALVSSYCHNYGISGQIFRLANITGSRSGHGIIGDFINKLKLDDKRLEILGNGQQSKSYLHINDCVKCMLHCVAKINNGIKIFNVGNEDEIDVMSIAKIVCKTMKLQNVEFVIKDVFRDGRGWMGDVKKMNLDISKLIKDGWLPELSSSKAVELAAQELFREKINFNYFDYYVIGIHHIL